MKSWIGLMIRRRKLVMALCLLFTVLLMSQLKRLSIVINVDNMLPQANHYIQTGNEIERTFGNKALPPQAQVGSGSVILVQQRKIMAMRAAAL